MCLDISRCGRDCISRCLHLSLVCLFKDDFIHRWGLPKSRKWFIFLGKCSWFIKHMDTSCRALPMAEKKSEDCSCRAGAKSQQECRTVGFEHICCSGQYIIHEFRPVDGILVSLWNGSHSVNTVVAVWFWFNRFLHHGGLFRSHQS